MPRVKLSILDTTDSAADDRGVPMYLANLTRQNQADEQHLSADEPLHVDSSRNPDGVWSYASYFGPDYIARRYISHPTDRETHLHRGDGEFA